MSLSEWMGKKLVVRDVDGTLQPPAAGPGLRLKEPDDSEFTIIARGEAFDLYFGRRVITNVSITAKSAMKLAVWLVWWWVRHAWFGIKLRLWRWVRVRSLERRWKADG